MDRARDLVMKYGWNSTCYQMLNPKMEHWFSADGEAMIGFVRVGRTAVVAGAPVCALDSLRQVLVEWRKFARSEGLATCFVGAESRLQGAVSGRADYTTVILGSHPEWSPRGFLDSFVRDSSLRAQVNRARNKGVSVSEWDSKRAETESGIRDVLAKWLESRKMPTLHFLVEASNMDRLGDRRIFVAEVAGRVVGFVTLCPIPTRNGWLAENVVRDPGALNGTVELMLRAVALALVDEGVELFSLGMVPLASRGVSGPLWVRLICQLAKRQGGRFYNFSGVERFKAKFHPVRWNPVAVIVSGRRFLPVHLTAIVGAYAGAPVGRIFLESGVAGRRRFVERLQPLLGLIPK